MFADGWFGRGSCLIGLGLVERVECDDDEMKEKEGFRSTFISHPRELEQPEYAHLAVASLVWEALMTTESGSRVDVVAHYQVAHRSKPSCMRYY
jgi:hypothetical protein